MAGISRYAPRLSLPRLFTRRHAVTDAAAQLIADLQTVSAKLRSGRPHIRKRLIREDGLITGMDEEHLPFNPGLLAKSGQRIVNDLAGAELDDDDRLLAGACMADFLDAVAPYGTVAHAAEQRTLARELRSALGLVE
jgi:hypothetical protein